MYQTTQLSHELIVTITHHTETHNNNNNNTNNNNNNTNNNMVCLNGERASLDKGEQTISYRSVCMACVQ